MGGPTAAPLNLSGVSFTRVTAGGAHSCAISTVGTAYCWGANGNGQLGIGAVSALRTLPTLIANP